VGEQGEFVRASDRVVRRRAKICPPRATAFPGTNTAMCLRRLRCNQQINRKGGNKMSKKNRNVAVKVQMIADAWESLAADATFAGMTLTQFRNRVKPSLDLREELAAMDSQRTAKAEQRDDADRASLQVVQMVANAVKGDPNYGPDHPLLQSMGYVRKSARWSGLTRKSNGNGNGSRSATAEPAELTGATA